MGLVLALLPTALTSALTMPGSKDVAMTGEIPFAVGYFQLVV